MRKYIFSTLFLVLLTSGSVLAKKDSKFMEKATSNYLHALNSDISTLVESAIFNLIVLKQLYPEHEYDAIIAKLSSLSMSSDIPIIRYKAFLALNYFKHKEWFGEYHINREKPILVFSDISEKMAIRNKLNFINGN